MMINIIFWLKICEQSHTTKMSAFIRLQPLNASYLSIFVQNKFMRMMKGTSLVEDSKKWQRGHIIYHF